MNAERLHAIARAVKDDFTKTKIVQSLQQLTSALQNMVNQPGHPQYQSDVSEARIRVQKALASSATNEFSPAWRQMLEETGVWYLTGARLAEAIEHAFLENQITPSVVLEDVSRIQAAVEDTSSELDRLVGSLSSLDVGHEDLGSGECEVGILIPRPFVSNRLDLLAEEFQKLSKILAVFQELAEGNRPGFEIRTISTSDFLLFLQAQHETCACIAIALERIVALYKSLLEIKKLRTELKAQGVDEAALSGVSKHADGLIDAGIAKIVAELLHEYGRATSDPRNNEIGVELKFSLKRIVSRIDRGFNFDVRVGPPAQSDEEVGAEGAAFSRSYARISAAASNLQFLKSDGEPILQLEEGRPPDDVQ
jgi:hypothetical protein